MLKLIAFLIGFLIGSLVTMASISISRKHKRVGKLRMDDSTGDPYLFMEIEKPIEYILCRREILLEIDLTPITRE